ncbi:MAG: complex I subunit 5 family protein [Bacillota bacterium]
MGLGSSVSWLATIQMQHLPVMIILLPMLAAGSVLLLRRQPAWQLRVVIAAAGAVLLSSLALIPEVSRAPVEMALVNFMGLGLLFRVDLLSLIFLLLFAFVSTVIVIYTTRYIECEPAGSRFLTFTMLTLAGILGVILAGDFLTLFLFFEMMTFASYVLVIHRERPESMRAGGIYLFLGVIGGLALLLAVFVTYSTAGTLEFVPSLAAFEESGRLITVLALFTVGFGLKAGMFPLYVWMPRAYSVSPSPANAISSGLMIKTGVYGLIRVFASTFRYEGTEGVFSGLMEGAGLTLIWIGIVTMLIGAVAALLQKTVFETLAYSSISQIGYILMGLGTAVYLGSMGAVGLAGATYHVINHTLFKTTLFLVVGVIYMHTRELTIDRLGGFRDRYPFLMGIFAIAALGIVGMPGFNGYPSKCLLHHAIVEAGEHHHLVSLWWAERIFTLASAFTVCYFTKLFRGIFLGRLSENHRSLPEVAPVFKVTLGVLAAAMLFIGVAPHALLRSVITPSLASFGYSDYAIHHVVGANLWDVHDLMSMAKTFFIAAIFYALYVKLNAGHWRFPAQLSLEYLICSAPVRRVLYLSLSPAVVLDRVINGVYEFPLTGMISTRIMRGMDQLERQMDHVNGEFTGRIMPRIRQLTDEGERSLQRGEEMVGRAVPYLIETYLNLSSEGERGLQRGEEILNRVLPRLRDAGLNLTEEGEQKLQRILADRGELSSKGSLRLLHRVLIEHGSLDPEARTAIEEGRCPFASSEEERESYIWDRFNLTADWSLRNLNLDGLIVAAMVTVVLLILALT